MLGAALRLAAAGLLMLLLTSCCGFGKKAAITCGRIDAAGGAEQARRDLAAGQRRLMVFAGEAGSPPAVPQGDARLASVRRYKVPSEGLWAAYAESYNATVVAEVARR